MNKELIELQRGSNATCVVILDENSRDLGQTLIMDANIQDKYLFGSNPIFKNKLDRLSSKGILTYFVIRGIDELSSDMQNRYIGLVKDREFNGYNIPKNVIIVFTVKTRDNLKKISKELYQFCVVAF